MFGIPGDYVLAFYSMLEHSPINLIGCCREDNAGFAADAYARVNGMGAVCVTYCVGGLSVANSIAGAYAEKSPVVLITGSPGMRERIEQSAVAPQGARFSHAIRSVREVCAWRHRAGRPDDGLPRDRSHARSRGRATSGPSTSKSRATWSKVVPDVPYEFRHAEPTSDPEALAEAVAEATRIDRTAARSRSFSRAWRFIASVCKTSC